MDKKVLDKPGKKEEDRKYCSFEHIQNVMAFCNVCRNYICETCMIEAHFNHDIVHLEPECMKKYSDYKRVVYEAQLMCKQFEKMSETESVDEMLNSLTTKVAQTFDQLIEKILAVKENKIKEIIESPEIQAAINEKKFNQEETLQTLKSIQADATHLMETIQNDYTNKRFILLYERDSAKEIEAIKNKLNAWKASSTTNPLKMKQYCTDITIDVRAPEHKLKSLVKVSHLSKPPPQYIYDFDTENNNLLLFDMAERRTTLINLGLQFHIPFHYGAVLLGKKIYFAGGDDDGYRKDCFAISIAKGSVKKLSDLNIARRNHSLAAFHISRIIYVVGGYNKDDASLNSVEKYSIAEGVWKKTVSLQEKRQWPGVAQFNNRFLYCFAGSDSGTIERLDISAEEKGWEYIAVTKMIDNWKGKVACSAIQISPVEILVFGGCCPKDVDHTYVFDTETRTLTRKESMPAPSIFCQMPPVISNPFVGTIGWRNELIYIYDFIQNKWTTVSPDKYQPADWSGA